MLLLPSDPILAEQNLFLGRLPRGHCMRLVCSFRPESGKAEKCGHIISGLAHCIPVFYRYNMKLVYINYIIGYVGIIFIQGKLVTLIFYFFLLITQFSDSFLLKDDRYSN